MFCTVELYYAVNAVLTRLSLMIPSTGDTDMRSGLTFNYNNNNKINSKQFNTQCCHSWSAPADKQNYNIVLPSTTSVTECHEVTRHADLLHHRLWKDSALAHTDRLQFR